MITREMHEGDLRELLSKIYEEYKNDMISIEKWYTYFRLYQFYKTTTVNKELLFKFTNVLLASSMNFPLTNDTKFIAYKDYLKKDLNNMTMMLFNQKETLLKHSENNHKRK